MAGRWRGRDSVRGIRASLWCECHLAVAVVCGIACAAGWASNAGNMRVLATLAVAFMVQAQLLAAIVPRPPELAWLESEELPPPPLIIPTPSLSTNDVNQSSIMVLRWPHPTESAAGFLQTTHAGRPVPAPPVARRYSLKWAYSESGARRVREFTESHVGQRVQIRIGTFSTPPFLINNPNRAGRDGMHGISDADAKAIFVGLGGNEEHGSRWWPR